jgi:hypothetical protein
MAPAAHRRGAELLPRGRPARVRGRRSARGSQVAQKHYRPGISVRYRTNGERRPPCIAAQAGPRRPAAG